VTTASRACLWVLWAVSASFVVVAQPIQGPYYASGDYDFVHCPPPCACAPSTDDGWFMGVFDMKFSHTDPKFDYFLVQNVGFNAFNSPKGTQAGVVGVGTYRVEKTWGRVHQMTLQVSENSGPVYTFDSGLVPNEWVQPGDFEIELVSDVIDCERREIFVWAQPSIGCYWDCERDGDGDIDDFICFQTMFALGDPYADCDGNSMLTVDDFICFQTYYAVGC
jgi:hypothetical protein